MYPLKIIISMQEFGLCIYLYKFIGIYTFAQEWKHSLQYLFKKGTIRLIGLGLQFS